MLPPTYATLLLELDAQSGILLVTLNRPEALNALNQALLAELDDAFGHYIPNTDAVRGVIVTGAGGKSFVAGADIKEFAGVKDADAARRLSATGQRIFASIENSAKPVIAAVNGFALGGGCELAMACHIRIAGEKARFGQPEVNLGLIPGYGGTQRLTQLVGKGKALELMMTADVINATEAHRLGLANAVVAVGEEVAAARAMLEKILTKAPLAIAKVISSVGASFTETGGGAYTHEATAFAETAITEDFHEGVAAFVEKRAAHFKGA